MKQSTEAVNSAEFESSSSGSRVSADGLIRVIFLDSTFEDDWIQKNGITVSSRAYLFDGVSTISFAPSKEFPGHLFVDKKGVELPAIEVSLGEGINGTKIVPIEPIGQRSALPIM